MCGSTVTFSNMMLVAVGVPPVKVHTSVLYLFLKKFFFVNEDEMKEDFANQDCSLGVSARLF